MSLTPKNWSEFQHYKDRKPAWIKLHRALLDDYGFSCLPVASRALAPCLWLLASEYEDGNITASMEELAFRLRMTVKELKQALTPLIDGGFFVASGVLADCKQNAIPEKEREREKEREIEGEKLNGKSGRKKPSTRFPDGWKPSVESIQNGQSLGLSPREIGREGEKFKNYHLSRDNSFSDWDRAFNNWLIKAAEFQNKSPPSQTDPNTYLAAPNSPEFQAWRAHFRDRGQSAIIRELEKRVEEGRAFAFEARWPPGFKRVET